MDDMFTKVSPKIIASSEKKLISNLLKDYSKVYRPVKLNNQRVVVKFGVYLIQLIDLVNYYFNYLKFVLKFFKKGFIKFRTRKTRF